MTRLLPLICVVFTVQGATAQVNHRPIAARNIALPPGSPTNVGILLEAVRKQTGVAIDSGRLEPNQSIDTAKLENPTFWEVLTAISQQTGHPLHSTRNGSTIAFGPARKGTVHDSLEGPFRVTAQEIMARIDLDSGQSVYDITLEIYWEPRFPVYRMSSFPVISECQDDRGQAIKVPDRPVMSPVTGYQHRSTLRLPGLTRDSRRISKISGSFLVTASPRMIPVLFDQLDQRMPRSLQRQGIQATLHSWGQESTRWEADIELQYPQGQPEFESFESWASRNRLELVGPREGERYPASNFEMSESSRQVRATYRFLTSTTKGPKIENLKDWKLVYHVPAPLTEYRVYFTLKDLPLP